MRPSASLIAAVDDDASVRRALRRLLSAAGFGVETFASAPEFLAAGHQLQPSCLVVDIHLPGMTGFDLSDHLAALGSAIPIIFITARDSAATRARASGTGAAAYLRKPFRRQALLEAIARTLGQHG
jgi:FixJ family two-component response regulator